MGKSKVFHFAEFRRDQCALKTALQLNVHSAPTSGPKVSFHSESYTQK